MDETIANVPLRDNVVASAKRSAPILERRTSTPQVLGEKKLSSGFIFVQEFCKRKHSLNFGSERHSLTTENVWFRFMTKLVKIIHDLDIAPISMVHHHK